MKARIGTTRAIGVALAAILASSAFAQIESPGGSGPALAEPDLVILYASASPTDHCAADKPVAGVVVTLKNSGLRVLKTPTGAKLIVIRETRDGSTTRGVGLEPLTYVHDNWIELEPGESRKFSLGITYGGDPSALGGTSHRLKVAVNPDEAFPEASHENNTAHMEISFPEKYCQKIETLPRGTPQDLPRP